MADKRFNAAVSSSLDNSMALVTKPNQEVDRTTTGSKETEWQNSHWGKYNGYYRTNQGGSKAAIDKFAMWAVGKGSKSDAKTTAILEKIRGFGKDSFNGIMENQVRVKKIAGDSFGHIMRKKTVGEKIKNVASKITNGFIKYEAGSGDLLNLKPLNPSTIKTITNEEGMLDRYEQTDITGKTTINTFQPNEIFHLINDREADEIHGISVYECMENSLDKIQQLDNDMAVVFHRYVMPLMMFKVDTDNETEMAAVKAKVDPIINKGQSLYISKDAIEPESFAIPQFSTLDPLKWRVEWKQDSIKDIGIPELVLGKATDITEASAKIVYLSFQQTIEDEQRYLEEQVWLQLGLKLKYEFPARIEENLGEDEGKDSDINTGKKSEVKVTSEEVKKE